MNPTNRYSIATALNVLALSILASGCIVVVKEDDENDRRRYLHGSEWTLEVVFYRTQTLNSVDRAVEVQFQEDGTVSGKAICGVFSGEYEINENGGISVFSVESSTSCQANAEFDLVSSGLKAAETYYVNESALTISTKSEGYLSFSAK